MSPKVLTSSNVKNKSSRIFLKISPLSVCNQSLIHHNFNIFTKSFSPLQSIFDIFDRKFQACFACLQGISFNILLNGSKTVVGSFSHFKENFVDFCVWDSMIWPKRKIHLDQS